MPNSFQIFFVWALSDTIKKSLKVSLFPRRLKTIVKGIRNWWNCSWKRHVEIKVNLQCKIVCHTWRYCQYLQNIWNFHWKTSLFLVSSRLRPPPTSSAIRDKHDVFRIRIQFNLLTVIEKELWRKFHDYYFCFSFFSFWCKWCDPFN